MSNLHKRLIEERGVTDSTATQYLQILYKLNGSKSFKNLAWTKKYEDLEKIIDTYAKSTQSGIYGALTSTLSLFNTTAPYKAAHKFWQTKMLDARKERDELDASKKTEKQEQNWIDWDDVLKQKDILRDEVFTFVDNKKLTTAQYNLLLDFVVISLYTDFTPRRNQDYLYMYVVKKLPKEYSKDRNYYDITNQQFIFNKYKTVKTYGEQKFPIPDSLKTVIDIYLKHHPLNKSKSKEFKLLVKQDGTPFTTENSITRILNRVFGKKVGSSQLRHSYVSSKYGGSLKEQRMDSQMMGHSVEEQNKTYIKYD
jgi:integrase